MLSERLCIVQGHFQGSLCLSKNILQTHRPKSKKARHVVKLEPFTTLRITGASCVDGSWAWYLVLLTRDKVNSPCPQAQHSCASTVQCGDTYVNRPQHLCLGVFIDALWKLFDVLLTSLKSHPCFKVSLWVTHGIYEIVNPIRFPGPTVSLLCSFTGVLQITHSWKSPHIT